MTITIIHTEFVDALNYNNVNNRFAQLIFSFWHSTTTFFLRLFAKASLTAALYTVNCIWSFTINNYYEDTPSTLPQGGDGWVGEKTGLKLAQ